MWHLLYKQYKLRVTAKSDSVHYTFIVQIGCRMLPYNFIFTAKMAKSGTFLKIITQRVDWYTSNPAPK